MPRGYVITPQIKTLTTRIYTEHPNWKAAEIRNVVRGILEDEGKKNPELLPKLAKGWPSLSAIQGIVKNAKGNLDKPHPQDELWSVGTLNDFPISPEALPIVLIVWKFRVVKKEPLTIRQVKWIARLSKVSENIETLSLMADKYAHAEFVCELAGYTSFDTTALDRFFMGVPGDVIVETPKEGPPLGLIFLPKILGEHLNLKQLSFPQAPESQVYGKAILSLSKEDMKELESIYKELLLEWKNYVNWVNNEREHKTTGQA